MSGRWHGRGKRRGWSTATALANPRPPAVPLTLELTLEEYYAAAAMIGLISAQVDEPDHDWVSEWALKQGANTAAKARQRRKRRAPEDSK